jgi:uncharacterized membrane protein YfcA
MGNELVMEEKTEPCFNITPQSSTLRNGNVMHFVLSVALGLIAGILSGAFGIGGGTVIRPHAASGTGDGAGVMLPPVFLLAALRYYGAGHVKVQMASFIACGFIVGALLGAHFIQGIPDAHLRRAFGIFLILIGMKMALVK